MNSKVDTFIDTIQPVELRKIAIRIQQIIQDSLPQVQESIKYKIPFWNYKGNLCYLNPQKDHIVLGFVKGIYLSNTQGVLVGNGKQVRHLIYKELESLEESTLVEILNEAAMLNE
ncbi:MAG: DUF1801 domain-containing protein [Aureispira sp.]|nr:DUF1801 domain-containing protein [Aureispira sp.]